MADDYQVLARKWRPRRFDDVVGQPAIVRTLRNALDQRRIAHAYCFSGIRGVGKTTCARLVAMGLNCHGADEPTGEPCGECVSCREIEESRSLDVVEMDAASQTGVDDIRELKEFTRYSPSRDRYRVFIIDEAHMLSRSAFNALLKTLEEPPSHVVFILATTEPHRFPETVLSRCQHYHFGRISQADIAGRLRKMADGEGVTVSDDSLALLAIAADGSLRDAQSLFDKLISFAGETIDDEAVVDLLGLVDRELLARAADRVAGRDLEGLLDLVREMAEHGVDLHQFALDLVGHFRDLTVARTAAEPGKVLHLPDAEIQRLRDQAERFELEDLDRAFSLLADSEYRIKQAEHPRFHLEMVLLRLGRMPHLRPLAELIADLRGGGGGSPGAGGRTPASPSPGGGEASHEAASAADSTRRRSDGDTPPGRASRIPASSEARAEGEELRAPPPPGSPPDPEVREEAPAQIERASQSNGSGPAPTGGATSPDPSSGGDPRVARIAEVLRERRPMIAQILGRIHSVEVRDDTLWLTFPSNGGLFMKRLQDRETLAAVEEAAEVALGRKLRVMVGSVDDEEGPVARETGGTSEPGADRGDRRREALWERAENEPLVQRFVDALKGQITKVEEP